MLSQQRDRNEGIKIKVEFIEHNGTKYAEIIWADAQVNETTFVLAWVLPSILACWATRQA